ncbi:hypothetical protein [Psychroserpens sp. NJDZ02]|uniref:hypothetical protein n=1 Tax=Psychroserpens sp. NJDZ02 TaxID=2570561 RepID=UPI0010A84293|nr:hypothetical protein [Psychroserpens sp. NJDZ02]QCE42765.1 hypothetical protein E9099_15555 [Psychroserpens sp. NJDZ02]
MKTKFNLLIFLILISQSIYSQKSEMPKEQKDYILSMKFEMTQDLFKKPKYDFKSQNLDFDKKFLKSNKTKESIISSIKHLEQNSKLEIKNERTKSIELRSSFPKNFVQEEFQVISIKIAETNLFGNNNIQSNQLSFDSEFDKNLTGEVSYNVKFITNYSKEKISKIDIGKTIELSGNEYKIIDIYENKIVLKSNLDEKLTIDDIKVKCINLNKNGKMELVSDTFNMSSSLIDEKIYKLFKDDKDLSLDNYKSNFSFETVMNEELIGKYIIMELPAPIENEIILYEPIYGVNEKITVKL